MLSANDYLVLAGTLHGVHAITSRFTTAMEAANKPDSDNTGPVMGNRLPNSNANRSGIQSIETDAFNLYVFQTLTGVKFIIVTSPNLINHQTQAQSAVNSRGELQRQFEETSELFKQIYILYSDYVMKDPFYSLDMPIKNGLFDGKVNEVVNRG